MPLSQAETHALQSILVREGKTEPVQGTVDGGFAQVALAALTSLTGILTRVEILMEQITASGGGSGGDVPETEAVTTERKKRGPKPKDPAKSASDKAMDNPHAGHKEDGDNPFNDAAKPNGAAAPKDNTGFAPEAGGDADPLGDNTADISEPELKALLKEYMGRFGDQGVPKITALLTQFGVKRFQDLPADKYNAVAAAARKEM